MNFTFLCLVIILSDAFAMYNKDIICVIDKGQDPICKSKPTSNRRSGINNHVPSYDPYIPRANSVFYDCSTLECKTVQLYSLTQLASSKMSLKSCFSHSDNYSCETIRYDYLKNVDKLLLLTTNIRNKTFYMVDCLVYSHGGRVCHKKDDVDSYTKLVDTGTIARPNEPNILSQDEFICEEGQDKKVNCDLNPYVPYEDGVKVKETLKVDADVLLKRGSHVVILKSNCFNSWCGYSGTLAITRRSPNRYEPPGGKVFRCYYAKKQQICKELYGKKKQIYNERGWISS
ncbi:uncharacterized protein LOC115442493 [Manduca sexta]|uniref:uncharacterized protein LOC115442493 n=1 Tax=Manduca sexta TaxID=7130 RepID=UPI001890B500|nr:uncharacterized protein LOC115442493 [Manduca sexta]